MGGGEQTGFAVEVPGTHDELAKTFFTVEFAPGATTYASGPIGVDDKHTTIPLMNCIDAHTGRSSGGAKKNPDKDRKEAGGKDDSGCDD
jgi:hypothetical protein